MESVWTEEAVLLEVSETRELLLKLILRFVDSLNIELVVGMVESVWTEAIFCEDSFFFEAVIALSVGPISLVLVLGFLVRISREGSMMRDIEDVDSEELTVVVLSLFFVDSVTGDVVGIVGRTVLICDVDVTISLVELSTVFFEESRPISILDEDRTKLSSGVPDEDGLVVSIGVVDVDSSIGETDGFRLVFIVVEVSVTDSTSDDEVTELARTVSFVVDAVETSVLGDVVGMGLLEDPGVFIIVSAGLIDLTMLSEEDTLDEEVETLDEEDP
eukprot:sb/3468114/